MFAQWVPRRAHMFTRLLYGQLSTWYTSPSSLLGTQPALKHNAARCTIQCGEKKAVRRMRACTVPVVSAGVRVVSCCVCVVVCTYRRCVYTQALTRYVCARPPQQNASACITTATSRRRASTGC